MKERKKKREKGRKERKQGKGKIRGIEWQSTRARKQKVRKEWREGGKEDHIKLFTKGIVNNELSWGHLLVIQVFLILQT